MKKIVLTSLLAVFAVGAANAGGAYIAGYATTSDKGSVDLLKSMTLDAAIGYSFQSGFRVEADVFSVNLYDGDENTDINFNPMIKLGYLKGLYDFKNDSKFTPYVGLGIDTLGLSYVWSDKADMSVASVPFFGEFIVGVSYAINDKMSLDLQYNREFAWAWTRVAVGSASASDSDSTGANTFKAGVVYKF